MALFFFIVSAATKDGVKKKVYSFQIDNKNDRALSYLLQPSENLQLQRAKKPFYFSSFLAAVNSKMLSYEETVKKVKAQA